LHAKLFVVEQGRSASLLTGSANATYAAFNGNVEFLVELTGHRAKMGIDALLAAEKGQMRLCDLFLEFTPGPTVVGPGPVEEEQLARLDTARCALAGREWIAEVVTLATNRYRVTLRATDGDAVPGDVVVTCRPSLLPEHAAVPFTGGSLELTFEDLSFEALTSFFAIEIRLADGSLHEPCRFLVNARLEGEPEGRRERLTQCLLENAEQVVRFLLLLLTNRGGEIGSPDEPQANGTSGDRHAPRARNESSALLEPLLRALHRDPYQLDQVRALLEDLGKTEEGRAKMPAGIDTVWNAVWQVREELRAAEAQT
jgi:hypothetical protein